MQYSRMFRQPCRPQLLYAPRISGYATWQAREAKSSFGHETRCVREEHHADPGSDRPTQLKATLATLEADLEALEESVE